MSSGSRSGYSRTISSADMPLAKRLTTSETVMRMPRIQARPPITVGSKVILSNIVRSKPAIMSLPAYGLAISRAKTDDEQIRLMPRRKRHPPRNKAKLSKNTGQGPGRQGAEKRNDETNPIGDVKPSPDSLPNGPLPAIRVARAESDLPVSG